MSDDTRHTALGAAQAAEAPDTQATAASSPGTDPEAPALDFAALRAGGRGPDGRWTKGAMPRLKHGLRVAPDHPALRVTFEDRRQAIERDLGGDLATLKAAAVREAARLTVIVEGLGEDLMSRGVLTAKGSQRSALGAFVTALDRLHRLMTLLGLERRPKPTAQRLEDYIDGGAR